MFMRKSNQNCKDPGVCHVLLRCLSIIGLAGVLLVGCGEKNLTEFVSKGAKPSVFKVWNGGQFTLNLSQGSWSPAYEIIDKVEYYYFKARFTATLVMGSDICFYDTRMETVNQTDGDIDLTHDEPMCDFGLVKWTNFTGNHHGLSGLHLSNDHFPIMF